MKIKPCTILDLGELTDIVNRFTRNDAMMKIRSDLYGATLGTWFLQGDCCMCYEIIGPKVAQAHIYSVSRESRGVQLRNFAIETGYWMVDNMGIGSVINLVDKGRRDLQFFMKMIGSQKVGALPNTEQILYISNSSIIQRGK